MTNTDIESDLLIKAINNEIRRNIIRLLMGKNMSYTELAHLLQFNLRKESGKFNFHLKQLADVGIVDNDNKEELYELTDKGEELYYLLLDIERDREIDPHGMLSALIRLEGPREFWFFISYIAMIAGLWAIMIGSLATFALASTSATLLYGMTLLITGVILEVIAIKYYLNTSNELLGERSTISKLFSTVLFLSIQWYLIRTKNRLTYLLATFVTLLGWFMSILAGLLHIEEGIESVGPVLYYLEIVAAIALLVASILLKKLYLNAKNNRD